MALLDARCILQLQQPRPQADALAVRAVDVADFVASGYSFEDAHLARDRARLIAPAGSSVPLVQVVVIASAALVTASQKWDAVLSSMPAPALRRSVALPPSGEALIALWTVERSAAG